MIKGGNSFVPSVPLRIAVRGGGVDTMALLLTEGGAVGGDGDVVFHGAPVHPSGAVRLTEAGGGTAWLDVGLAVVEDRIARVLVVGSTENGTMRDVAGLSVEAFAPDGASVARYDVTDGAGETAMVLAELYRRAGGWKFRAVGQGYVNGLEGLAADHGVEVAEEEAEAEAEETPQVPIPTQAPGPTPLPAPAKIQAPSQDPTPLPPAYPYPPVAQGPSDWTFGAVFEPRTLTGTGNEVIDVEALPPGPVMVEIALRTDGYTGVWTLSPENKEADLLVNSTEKNFRGRLLCVVPESGRLRLKLRADGPWQAQVLPLAAAKLLTEDTMESWGPNVLLHTGGAIDVAFHYRGDSNFIVDSYDLAGHDDPTTLPDSLWPHINEIGRRRESLSLPAGPVLVHLQRADGPWRARLKQPSAATAWLRRARR